MILSNACPCAGVRVPGRVAVLGVDNDKIPCQHLPR
jgi:hypothetical protein